MKLKVKHPAALCLLTAAAVLVMSCSFRTESVGSGDLKDVSEDLKYDNLSAQAFMGGSLMYIPEHPSESQLIQGAAVAVRLGNVTVSGSEGEKRTFTDIPNQARYGYLVVDSIDRQSITKGGMGASAELSLRYDPIKSDNIAFILCVGYEGIFPNKGATSSGSVGYDDGLIEDIGYKSKWNR